MMNKGAWTVEQNHFNEITPSLLRLYPVTHWEEINF